MYTQEEWDFLKTGLDSAIVYCDFCTESSTLKEAITIEAEKTNREHEYYEFLVACKPCALIEGIYQCIECGEHIDSDYSGDPFITDQGYEMCPECDKETKAKENDTRKAV